MTMDDFTVRLAPSAAHPVDAKLLRARESMRAALAALRDVPDDSLERNWEWRAGRDLDVRYGLYRQYETLADARARVQTLLAEAGAGEGSARPAEGPARPLLAAASAARWSLHGLLAGLADDDLDRDPGNGEWTVRQTLAHIVSGQRGYAWYTAWWLTRHDAPGEDLPASVPDDAIEMPEEEVEGKGSLADIQSRLDEIVDLSVSAYQHLGAAELAARARWSGVAIEVRFRLGRWGSHIREHTIQVEKTLVYIGRPLTEVERLERLIGDAYGRLEEELFPAPASSPRLTDAMALVESAAVEVEAGTRSVVEAARS